eukprot:2574315-Heterocapsa_arctica.AAC.1
MDNLLSNQVLALAFDRAHKVIDVDGQVEVGVPVLDLLDGAGRVDLDMRSGKCASSWYTCARGAHTSELAIDGEESLAA